MTAIPCPASARASRFDGARLSITIFGLSLARRQTASNVLRTTKPVSSRSSGQVARALASIVLPSRGRNVGWHAASSSIGGTSRLPKDPDVNCVKQDTEVDVAAFKHREDVGTNRLEHSHLHFWV